jgi:cation:H+ antiporter
MTHAPTPLIVALFAASLAATLLASAVFARRLDRLGRRFGWPEALVGLLTAIAADGPELSSAIAAMAHGSQSVGVGVVVGSNLFNLAAMIGAVALLTGSVRIGRRALSLEGGVALSVAGLSMAVLGGALPAWVATLLCVGLGAAYLAALGVRPGRAAHRLASSGVSRRRGIAVIVVELPSIAAIGLGSLVMVRSALMLAERWHLSDALVGLVILAIATSVPNAFTALRLGLAGRGDALVSEALHSNSINVVGALLVPALILPLHGSSTLGLGLMVALTALTLGLLARAVGVDRPAGVLIMCVYVVAAGVLVAGYA